MGKGRSVWTCTRCGYRNPQYLGRCPECEEWGSLVEEAQSQSTAALPAQTIPLDQIRSGDLPRIITGIAEVDRVFGGGIVPGSVSLVGGDPGIGKSTLVLHISQRVAEEGREVLYFGAEESPFQLKLRAQRLGVTSSRIRVISETACERIVATLESVRPALAIVDSIQMIYRADLSSAPGSVGQVRETAAALTRAAKKADIALVLIGHVTKEGAIAGPRTLEHLVDSVFYFEGDRFRPFRLLRAIKNRFGPTSEVGVFEMTGEGLREVKNPSEMFFSRDRGGRVGSVIVPTVLGTRVLAVEVQALTGPSPTPYPARRASGFDPNRLAMLAAVLNRRCGLDLEREEIYANIPGGVQVEEPAVDLGVCVAIGSSLRSRAVDERTAMVGEVGLSGEVRGVQFAGQRVEECRRLGFARVLVPADSGLPLSKDLVSIGTVIQAMEELGLM